MKIRIDLPENTSYVGGTVNGNDVLFENIGGNTWETDVPRAYDNQYTLDLQLVDEAGNTSSYTGTFEYEIPIFIYDRTQEDVDRVKELNGKYLDGTITEREKAEWHGHMKGALNAWDLRRIERNTELIGEYVAVLVTTNTEWDVCDLPRESDYKRIRDNVERIREFGDGMPFIPETPVQPLNTYQKWNDIEKILHDIFWLYIGNYNNRAYCGEISCGEEIGVI